jgi:hypothetical protein
MQQPPRADPAAITNASRPLIVKTTSRESISERARLWLIFSLILAH